MWPSWIYGKELTNEPENEQHLCKKGYFCLEFCLHRFPSEIVVVSTRFASQTLQFDGQMLDYWDNLKPEIMSEFVDPMRLFP